MAEHIDKGVLEHISSWGVIANASIFPSSVVKCLLRGDSQFHKGNQYRASLILHVTFQFNFCNPIHFQESLDNPGPRNGSGQEALQTLHICAASPS